MLAGFLQEQAAGGNLQTDSPEIHATDGFALQKHPVLPEQAACGQVISLSDFEDAFIVEDLRCSGGACD